MIRKRKQQPPNVLPLVHNGGGGRTINGGSSNFPGISSRRRKRRGSSKDAIVSYYLPYFLLFLAFSGFVVWYFMTGSSTLHDKAIGNDSHHHHHHQYGHHSHRRVDPTDIHDQFAQYKQARANYDKTAPKRHHPGATRDTFEDADKLPRLETAGARQRPPRRTTNTAANSDSGESTRRHRKKIKGEQIGGRTQEDGVGEHEPIAGIVEDDKEERNPSNRRRALDSANTQQDDSKTEAPVEVKCSDGSQGYLNDQFCDCPDGNDETETAACSHLTIQKAVFHCKGDDTVIYASRVGDSVRDCPDGSDELATTNSSK